MKSFVHKTNHLAYTQLVRSIRLCIKENAMFQSSPNPHSYHISMRKRFSIHIIHTRLFWVRKPQYMYTTYVHVCSDYKKRITYICYTLSLTLVAYNILHEMYFIRTRFPCLRVLNCTHIHILQDQFKFLVDVNALRSYFTYCIDAFAFFDLLHVCVFHRITTPYFQYASI